MKLWIILIIIFTRQICFSLDFVFDGTNRDILNNCDVYPKSGNILQFSEFNLFDNDFKTAAAINIKNGAVAKKFAYFQILLKNEIKIDEIILNNGYQKNYDLYLKNQRVKEIAIYIQNQNDKFGKYSFKTNFNILDVTNSQSLKFPSILMKNLIIGVLSTYPGSKYDDICVSEVEFWYKGEKYQVANLEEAKKEYIAAVEDRLNNLIRNRHYAYHHKTLFFMLDGNIYEVADGRAGAHVYANYLLSKGEKADEIPASFYKWKKVNGNLYFKPRSDTNNDEKMNTWKKADISAVRTVGRWALKDGFLYLAKDGGALENTGLTYRAGGPMVSFSLKSGPFQGDFVMDAPDADPYIDGM